MVTDEPYRPQAERLWLAGDHVLCAEIGYVEARAALAAAQRAGRLDSAGIAAAKRQLESL